ncbi:calcitonin receptor-like protein 1 [Gigantopelta aegis]|uniref:calcitonin receptor-like protein 1 n=1 Tax=Gigantopelta aegis TaxID=1735272 RepID=UPI001B88A484|nr:calcitonin receptor-like protein 1 [Gigantopelta aegis]
MNMRKGSNQAHVGGSLEECLATMGQFNIGLVRFCNATWDGILCWPPTLPGMTIRQQCPDREGFTPDGYAYKTCGSNAKWFAPAGVDSVRGWTNYSNCMIMSTFQPSTVVSTTKKDPFPDGYIGGRNEVGLIDADDRGLIGNESSSRELLSNADVVGIVCNSLSVIFLVAAVFLFTCLVRHRTQRHKILTPLFVTSLLRFVAQLVEFVIPFLGQRNAAVCMVVSYVTHFSSLSTYAWIVVLGIYYLFAVLDDVIKRGGMFVLYMVGFGIPVVFTTAWVLTVTGVLPSEFASCHFEFVRHESRWIFDAPKLACILMAVCLLTVCVYALCRSSANEMTPEMTFACQGTLRALAFLILSAAVDLYLLIEEYREHARESSPRSVYLHVVLRGIMGTVMAAFLSFLDSEIWRGRRQSSRNEIVNHVDARQNGEKRSA